MIEFSKNIKDLDSFMNLQQVLELPQGKIREPELKEIPDIFSQDNLEVALEILNQLNDCKHIIFQADVLERAYKYGWNKKELQNKSLDKAKNQHKKEKENILESLQLFCLIGWSLSCSFFTGLTVVNLAIPPEFSQDSIEIIKEKNEDYFVWLMYSIILFGTPIATIEHLKNDN